MWIASKTWLRGAEELGNLVGPLIQAEELIKLDPNIAPRIKVRYQQLRERVKERYGTDMVAQIAEANAIGELSVEAHARAVVTGYRERIGLTDRAWLEDLTQEAVAASERAYALYFE